MTDVRPRHRLSAILAADAAGYSRLMSIDDVATVAALDHARSVFRAATARHGGRIVDMAGDSILAAFETALGAVQAAFEVQSGLAARNDPLPDERRLSFRIGIHLGDVIEKEDGTIYGDGVNIAARLQGLARPGSLVISQSVHTAVQGRLPTRFTDIGEQSVKNIAQPVRAYEGGGAAYAFGEFVLDERQRRLSRSSGEPVALIPPLFDALLFFVSHPGTLVDRQTLHAALWPGVVVEDNRLLQTVSALRRALGDDVRGGRYLQTVPRRGFRFVAPVELVPEADPIAGTARADRDAASLADARASTVVSSRRRLVLGAAAGVALVAAGSGAWWWARERSARSGAPTSLAILPFRPLTVDQRDEMLEVGMADSLITRLSNLPGVAVRSIGSVRPFAGSNQDPLASARELNVQWIVDGSLQRIGDKVRVTSRLLDTNSGEAAWSGSFDEDFTSVFALQDAISTRVAQVLAPRLSRSARQSLAGIGTTRNVDAYQLYLTARQQAQGIRSAGLGRSIELYRKAIDLDPAFALAFAGIAESNRRLIFGADAEPRIVFAAADIAVHRTIELAPSLSDGYASLGWDRFWYDWNWTEAESAFRRALDLSPNDVNARLGYGQLLETLARDDEGATQMRIARELDPLSLIGLTLESAALYGSGHRDEARQRLQRVFDIEPDFWVAHLTLGSFLINDGQVDQGIHSIERAEQLADGSSQPAAALGYVLARRGDPRRAREIADRLLALDRDRYVPPTSYGVIYAGLGEKELALSALEKAVAVRDTRMTTMRGDKRWSRALGDEPRYRAAIARMNFPG